MTDTIHIYWPGDYRPTPNQLALPMVEESTQQLERALDRLGRKHARVPGLLTRPHESIERLGPIDEPLVGVYAHWVYGPHTTDGVVGKDSPLLLTSNFSGTWPGLVGLLNTAACLESVDRRASRAWTDATDWSRDEVFMSHLASWCETGVVRHATHAVRPTPVVPPAAAALAAQVHDEFLRRRALVLMLGDTSMGMINGYFGPRALNKFGFTEHKVDQAWIIERGRQIAERRIDDAFEFVRVEGVTFHYGATGAEDFDAHATREQLRDYLVVLDLVEEFGADCVGWQYQLGLLRSRPPSRLRRRSAQLHVPAGVERRHDHRRHRGRPGQPRCRWR